jgi:hypothetical protein
MQPSGHRDRDRDFRSTCLPLSPSLHANSFVIGTAVIVLSQGATGTPEPAASLHAWRDPMICSSREHESCALSRDPQTRDAKWARGSRSQTHRRAAKGGFTQDDVKVERRLVPDRRPPSFVLCCSKSSDCSWVLKLVPGTDTGTGPIPPVTVLRVKPIAGECSREHCPRVYAICRPELG